MTYIALAAKVLEESGVLSQLSYKLELQIRKLHYYCELLFSGTWPQAPVC